jgi:hypothetical protein
MDPRVCGLRFHLRLYVVFMAWDMCTAKFTVVRVVPTKFVWKPDILDRVLHLDFV